MTKLPGHDSWVLLMFLGLLCLIFAPMMVLWSARLAGLVLLTLGIEQSVEGFSRGKYRNTESIQPAMGMILIIIGLIPLWQGEDALLLICAIWGVFGLFQAAHALNHVIAAISRRKFSWWKCAVALLETLLALELIFTGGDALILHIRLLGLELLAASHSYRIRETMRLE